MRGTAGGREDGSAVLDLGGMRLRVLDGGTFRLDGATLYGILPKVFWEKKNRPDEDNRVLLASSPLLVEGPFGKVVIDPGIGSGWGPRAVDRYALQGQRSLAEMLGEADTDPGEVKALIATHLHFDHVAAAVLPPQETAEDLSPREWAEQLTGDLEPALPSAALFVQEEEVRAALQPDLRTAAFVAPAVCTAYEQAGRLARVMGDDEPFPGVRLERTGGHTPGHQVVWLEGSERTVLMPGDMVPTTTHLRGEVQEGMDHQPSRTASAKAGLLSRLVATRGYMTFYHAPRVLWARVLSGPSGSYQLEEIQTAAPTSLRG
ncbi:MAG: MBL fold metallo-hydrolase [bacterium]